MQHTSSIKNLKEDTITYRNGIYQGNIDYQSQCRTKFGIVYQAKTHQFICCKNWQYDRLSGQSMFFNSDKRYSYGYWLNNKPNGFNVFRIQQIVVFLVFKHGKIQKYSKIIIFHEKYNLGLILNVKNQTNNLQNIDLEVYEKKQIFSSQDLYQLFKQCQWPQNYFIDGQTLIRFISNKMILPLSQSSRNKSTYSQKNPVKLRLLSNQYYRFGYDQGLALIFDEDYKRISVGMHNKAKLKSYGVSYNHSQSGTLVEEGLFDKDKLFKFDKKGMNIVQQRQLNKVYNQSLLTSVNFSNSFYRNISKVYQSIIENLIVNSDFLKQELRGYQTTRKLMDQQTLKFSKIQEKAYESESKDYIFPQTHEKDNHKNSKSGSIYKNQILNDRLRLQTIKKQIYGSIQRKKISTIQYQNPNKDTLSSKQFIGHYFNNSKRDEFTLYEPNRQNPQLLQTPQRTVDKQRSRKKIFEQSQRNKKLLMDFTPSKSQKNLTPFKTKMKNRIFDPNYIQKNNSSKNVVESKFNSNDLDQKNKIKQQLKNIDDSRFKAKSQKRDVFMSGSDHQNSYKRDSKLQEHKSMKSSKNHLYVPINARQQKMKKKINITLNERNTNSFQEEETNGLHNKRNQKINQNQEDNNFDQNINSYKLIYSESKKGLITKNRPKNSYDNSIKNSPNVANKKNNQTPQRRKSLHRHSNSIYLHGQDRSPKNYEQKNNRRNNEDVHLVHSPIKMQIKSSSKNSYMKKYENKKQLDKQIQRSPDKFRCYGKSNQHPYLQPTFNQDRLYSHQNSFHKGILFQQTSAKSYYNQTLSFARQKKQKFF